MEEIRMEFPYLMERTDWFYTLKALIHRWNLPEKLLLIEKFELLSLPLIRAFLDSYSPLSCLPSTQEISGFLHGSLGNLGLLVQRLPLPSYRRGFPFPLGIIVNCPQLSLVLWKLPMRHPIGLEE